MTEIWSRMTALPTGYIQPLRSKDFGFLANLIRDGVGATDVRRLIVLPLALTDGESSWISGIVQRLCRLLEASWPNWFADQDFGWFRNDPLGEARLRGTVRGLATRDGRISRNWLSASIRSRSKGRPLAGASWDPTVQVAQTCLALSPAGIVLFLPFEFPYEQELAVGAVAAVEWIARHADVVVVPVIPDDWPDVHPVDRLLFRSWRVVDLGTAAQMFDQDEELAAAPPQSSAGITAVLGQPHPLSDIEKRMWAHLSQDGELASLFRCNQTVVTRHGGRPRVDLLWSDGRVVVELDGYADHSVRDAFERDRHRDYELTISGYTVLRITNDEVQRDLEAAVGKIRDVVKLKRYVDLVEEVQ